jgi:hypothetical protein
MYYRSHPQGLRLGIELEAETLISNSGVDAYRIARRRADESSSQQMAKDWSKVAVAIAHKTRQRRAVLAAMLADAQRAGARCCGANGVGTPARPPDSRPAGARPRFALPSYGLICFWAVNLHRTVTARLSFDRALAATRMETAKAVNASGQAGGKPPAPTDKLLKLLAIVRCRRPPLATTFST